MSGAWRYILVCRRFACQEPKGVCCYRKLIIRVWDLRKHECKICILFEKRYWKIRNRDVVRRWNFVDVRKNSFGLVRLCDRSVSWCAVGIVSIRKLIRSMQRFKFDDDGDDVGLSCLVGSKYSV